MHDLHATILWLLGLDNMGLVYNYKGRPKRPTLSEGGPYEKIAVYRESAVPQGTCHSASNSVRVPFDF